MNTYQDLQHAIDQELQRRSGRIVNRNAFAALLAAMGSQVEALGKIFLGRQEALDAEKARLMQDAVLEMLCKIDDAISSLNKSAEKQGISIAGFIEAEGHNSDSVIGAHIGHDAQNVRIQPGTHIRAGGSGNGSVIGLKIGG